MNSPSKNTHIQNMNYLSIKSYITYKSKSVFLRLIRKYYKCMHKNKLVLKESNIKYNSIIVLYINNSVKVSLNYLASLAFKKF